MLKRKIHYNLPQNSITFCVSEETASYGSKKPFTIYYDNPEHSVRLLKGDCIEILNQARENSVDMIFADPPYFLSNGGITCHAGKMVSVNKGKWDKSKGIKEDHEFTLKWLKACQGVLKPNGTIWVSGTTHIIYSVGYAMHELGYKILNDIIWYKRNAPPNLSCRYFTHSTEIVLWAAKNAKSKHNFNYQLMKKMNQGKQMRNVWEISAPPREEKKFGKHPTQKPKDLYKWLIERYSNEGDTVLDPTADSFNSVATAHELNRKAIGIEMNKEFFDKFNTTLPHKVSS
jgi:site-specific DNA-methyltransferase (adenine-specific)